MCICVNCRHASFCTTYKLIQKQHGKKDINKNLFIPINTLIQININSKSEGAQFDWDLIECLSFIEKPGQWLIEQNTKKYFN